MDDNSIMEIIIIIISIFKVDNVFSLNANLPYSPPLTTDIDYLQAFCLLYDVSDVIYVRRRVLSQCWPCNAEHQAR